MQYWHAWLYSQGIWTVPKEAPVDDAFRNLANFVDSLTDEPLPDE